MEHGAGIEYGVLKPEDAETAGRLYLEAFPGRLAVFASKPACAGAFARDWMELMRRATGPGFIAARREGQLVGFILLLLPETRLVPALLRDGLALRLAARALAGRYGFSLRLLPLAFRRLTGRTGMEWPAESRLLPHVDVILVRPDHADHGIGTALLHRARQFSEPRFEGLSLLVETENQGAIGLYERVGFRVIHTQHKQHLMVWKFSASKASGWQSGKTDGAAGRQ